MSFKSKATQECKQRPLLEHTVKSAMLHTIKVMKESPQREIFLSGYLPISTSLDSHNTQQEHLNRKLVRFSPCCALLHLVTLGASIQPWQPGPQNNNANVFHSLVSCASTLTSMMANSVLPVCLSKSVQAKFSILSCHGSVDNATYGFIQVDTYKTVLIVTVWQRDAVLGTLWNPDIGSVKDMGEKVRQYWTKQLNAGFFIVGLRLNPDCRCRMSIQWV